MLRQNRSEGSSTSRSFAKTALLRARRKTFQFSDEQFARHIFFTEPLFLIPSVQTEVQESGSTRGAILFSKEPLFLMPPGRAGSPRGSQGSRVRKGTAALFSREPLFLVPSAEIGCPETPADRIAGNHCLFFEGTTFPPSFRPRLAQQEATTLGWQATDTVFSREPLSLIPLGSRTPRWPQSLSGSSFSSFSLLGGSGIPAVPKTGASVLRLLPPTS
jgi:hypothetical protein